jgi:hypothetical protein
VLGLAAGLREPGPSGGWLARLVAVVLVACGVAASWTGFTLAGTAKPDAVAGGWEIPALHSAASDQPVPATPDCASSSGFQVCVHPAFSFYLRDVAAALNRVAAQIAGLRGAPVRAEEVASMSGGQVVWGGISGNPPVFEFTAQHVGSMITGEFNGIQTSTGGDAVVWRQTFQTALLDAFLTGTGPSLTAPSQQMGPAVVLNAAQQAVENALMTAAGSPPQHIFSEMGGKPGSGTVTALSAAAQRFGRLSASARRAWLAAHLTALRAGTITVAQIP